MKYYIGTKNQCEYYNNKVVDNEKYTNGDKWGGIIKSNKNELYAIPKHELYTHSNMMLKTELPQDFHTTP